MIQCFTFNECQYTSEESSEFQSSELKLWIKALNGSCLHGGCLHRRCMNGSYLTCWRKQQSSTFARNGRAHPKSLQNKPNRKASSPSGKQTKWQTFRSKNQCTAASSNPKRCTHKMRTKMRKVRIWRTSSFAWTSPDRAIQVKKVFFGL